LACKSVGSTLSAGHPGHCEREDHQTPALFYSALDSSLFSNGTGHPSGGPWRQFHCTSCKGYFLETHGTLFHGKQATAELIVRVLACLVGGRFGHPCDGAGLRGRPHHGAAVVGRSGRAAIRLFRLFSL